MLSMVELNIFKVIKVFDLQGLCVEEVTKKNDGEMLWTVSEYMAIQISYKNYMWRPYCPFQPFKLISHAIKWIVMEMVIQWSNIRLWAEGASYDMIYDDDYSGGPKKIITKDDEVKPEPEKEKEKIYRACDKEANLYILQQNLFIQGGNTLPSHGKSTCSR